MEGKTIEDLDPPSQANTYSLTLFPTHSTCSNPNLCSPTNQLACESGDLTSKHGALLLPQQAGQSLRAVFTDPNLPLSGASSTLVLQIQPVGGAMTSSQNSVCTEQGEAMVVDAPVEPPPAPPTTAPPTTAGTTRATQNGTCRYMYMYIHVCQEVLV